MTQELLNVRNEYIALIRSELLGPGSEISIPDAEHELISTAPNGRYSIGILFPRGNKLNADNNDNSRIEETAEDSEDEDDEIVDGADGDETTETNDSTTPIEEDNLDEEIGLAAQNMPSSMGITFFAKGDSSKITCSVNFGTYTHVKAPDCMIPYYPDNPDIYTVPAFLSSIVFFDKETSCLRLQRGGVTRRDISRLKEQDKLGTEDPGLFDALYKLCNQLAKGFVRTPHSVEVQLNFGSSDYIDQNQKLDGTTAKLTALRRKTADDIYSVTVMLVNDSDETASGANCIFQPEIIIGTENNDFIFQEYSGLSDFSVLDEEEQSLEMQYRNKKVYATGLGAATRWDINSSGSGLLSTDFFPEVEVPGMDFNLPASSGIDSRALSMKYLSDLSDADKAEKITHLSSLVSAYNAWIEGLKAQLPELSHIYSGKYDDIATKNISGCEKAMERMLHGIDILQKDNNAWASFQLANRAMFMQRAHLKLQEQTSDKDRFPYDEELTNILDRIDYRTVDTFIEDRYAWRPFQLAFLLMSINSICSDDSDDRNLVDLIWFPTGGGKTEAYLGLTAFTIFYRRLAHVDQSGGTAVIMRYTLRLLAAQQFTRASTLICACEYIRRDSGSKKPIYGKYSLGSEPITIGLWIGGEHTPNKNTGSEKSAKSRLDKLLSATAYNLRDAKDRHNKFQVLKCPWCGTKLVKERLDKKLVGEFGYRMRNNSHFEIFCPQEACYFNEVGKLPIQIVDDELYNNPPTLLFGTVDKFAMLPWKKEIGAFFAVGSEARAPELIIQDELHLISGPLGTMVGLYETVIDALCSEKGVKPKIVASTATIRRAKEQCASLYNRDVSQFPHPALDAGDSFFSREATVDYGRNVFGRKYIGLMPSGKTKAMMEIRSIAALLQQINAMDIPDELKDKFWTLTVYFNSLKDLGKCTTLVDDDIKDFIKRTAFRLGTARDARMIARADELTSRVSTTELNETLDKLEKVTYSKKNIEKKRYPSNVLLATNMISVGIDVARLNVMLLVGQPKLTSEYIQASSRIGRSFPGVAFAMYDGSKSRDRSHYEQFKAYHESFYKYVEPTGVTPFSKPARDRALHAVVIAILRLTEQSLNDETAATRFIRDNYIDRINHIKALIVNRNTEVLKRLHSLLEDEGPAIAEEIDTLLEQWERLADGFDEDHFSYGEKYLIKSPEDGYGRLMKVYNSNPYDKALDTMTSMRNVDTTVAGNILVWED